MLFKLTMILRRESPKNAYTVTCVELPELITEGDTIDEALDNSVDAFFTTLGIYEELNKELPSEIMVTEPLADTPRFQTITPRENESDYWFEATVPQFDRFAKNLGQLSAVHDIQGH